MKQKYMIFREMKNIFFIEQRYIIIRKQKQSYQPEVNTFWKTKISVFQTFGSDVTKNIIKRGDRYAQHSFKIINLRKYAGRFDINGIE